MIEKYKFTGKTMEFEGVLLRQISYFYKFQTFISDEIGGWIESEHNLSHEGNCCVMDDAKVFGYARIEGNAIINGEGIVKDNAVIRGEGYVADNSIVGADTIIDGESWVVDESQVFFYHDIHSLEANLLGGTRITGNTIIEATGFIKDSWISDENLSGYLKIENKNHG